jgi:hypothetical protein
MTSVDNSCINLAAPAAFLLYHRRRRFQVDQHLLRPYLGTISDSMIQTTQTAPARGGGQFWYFWSLTI